MTDTMTFEEQAELRAWLHESLGKLAPVAETRPLVEAHHRGDSVLLSGLAALGFLGLAVAEASGGSGVPAVGQAIALHESGRVLLPTGYLFSSFVLPTVLADCADREQSDEILEAVASGTQRVVFADLDGPVAVTWDGAVLSGTKDAVLDADLADTFLVSVSGPSGPQFVLVAARDAVIVDEPPLDATRPALRVTFDGSSGRVLPFPDPATTLANARLQLALSLSAECSGSLGRCLELSVEYAKLREQFGHPIGRFQVIKHQCADMFVASQAVTAAVLGAAAAPDPRRISATAILASAQSVRVATMAMQLHGGIAFTWEHEVQLHLKRAKASQLLIAAMGFRTELLAADILDGGRTVIDSLIER